MVSAATLNGLSPTAMTRPLRASRLCAASAGRRERDVQVRLVQLIAGVATC